MHAVLRCYWVITFMFLFHLKGISQQYNFRNYTTRNGLSASVVNQSYQDSKGFIWFATTKGVSRFNGKTFQNYSTKQGLVSDDVTYITEDKNHHIWIATIAGVSEFNGIRFKNFTKKDGLTGDEVFCIYIDRDNRKWLALNKGGINIIDNNKITSIGVNDGLPSSKVFSICQDKNGLFWFATANGVISYNGKSFSNSANLNYFRDEFIFTSFSDSKGNVWFGGDHVVLKYDGNTISKIELPEINNAWVNSIKEDKTGNIWMATDQGVFKFEQDGYKLFTEKQGLSSNNTLFVNADNENNIWIGTSGGGVNLFNNESLTYFSEKEGLISKEVTSITYSDVYQEYYIGTGLGLCVLKKTSNQKYQVINEIPELKGVLVSCLMLDQKQTLWVGTYNGIYVLNKVNHRFKLQKIITSIKGSQVVDVLKIIEDSKGIVWAVSQSNGLFKIKNEQEFHYRKNAGLPTDNIFSIVEDSHSNLWLATQFDGVIKFDGQKFTQYSKNKGFPDQEVWSIAEDNRGNIFFGTGSKGLVSYDGKQFKTFTVDDGLCSNFIISMEFDKVNNCLWLATDNGLNKLKFNDRLNLVDIRYYTEKEGYKGIESTQNSIFKDKEGLIWFGSINGLTCYNPYYDAPNTISPAVYIDNIKLNYKDVNWRNYDCKVDSNSGLPTDLVLNYKDNHLSFNFQALTTDRVKYTYKLEGQDNDWSPLSENTEADYSNITPGHTYTFKVKAVNSYGNWTATITNFTFTINSPWYATWWAVLMYIVLGLTSTIILFKWRTANLKHRQKILEATVIERTSELDNSNKKLSHAFQEIKDSISYAQKIQTAILPLQDDIKSELEHCFILFKPRDVVSGDFYWFNTLNNKVLIAAVDCTGHGVPGAFMSMIGYSLLNEIVSKEDQLDAANILNKLHEGVRKSLKQNRDIFESKDGMDIALTVIDKTNKTLQYAGAKRPLLYYNGDHFIETKADKQSIGGLEIDPDFSFTNHNFELKKGDTFYLFTDGYVDQFGGEKDKKFSTSKFKQTLAQIQAQSLEKQQETLDHIIEDWKSTTEQTDDILVIGLRF